MDFMNQQQTDFIAGMFNITRYVRKNKKDSATFKEITEIEKTLDDSQKMVMIEQFVEKYFRFVDRKSEHSEKLFRLGKNIANAISFEWETTSSDDTNEYKNIHPYPPYYTNDLIFAIYRVRFLKKN